MRGEGLVRIHRMLAVLALALGLSIAACGGSGGKKPVVETPNPIETVAPPFAAFVIDLIQNQTTDDGEAVALPAEFTDTEDPQAFEVLFP
jgi:hypothetical protein